MADAHGSGDTPSVNLQNSDLSCKTTYNFINAGMAELADAHGSGPCESNFMQVQVLLPAPSDNNPNLLPVGDGFGFVFFYAYPNFNSKIDRFVR